ncbi:hypothetical protein [Roseiconus lacunae]|uniref:Uncharacterized protein n=1 Tax=Roseiconus lacunae TaxID=2605694 RepID=A0ABT7PI40_9BACT|nr:hypothetical protein [Roseiconus lacunae]MDM4016155.1 hypothetical protein [Roseiconus lacunae]WRQ51511.1 hypothetical protein U8335_03000 [Stieleria sp. HD01]
MFAQQPQPGDHTSEYGEPQDDAASAERFDNQQLLNDVLGETLARHQEDGGSLIDALEQLRGSCDGRRCDESLFVEIARQVLRHRLGDRFRRLPQDAFEEVGRAFWNNEQSRERIQQFWSTLGIDK